MDEKAEGREMIGARGNAHRRVSMLVQNLGHVLHENFLGHRAGE